MKYKAIFVFHFATTLNFVVYSDSYHFLLYISALLTALHMPWRDFVYMLFDTLSLLFSGLNNFPELFNHASLFCNYLER